MHSYLAFQVRRQRSAVDNLNSSPNSNTARSPYLSSYLSTLTLPLHPNLTT